MEKKTLLLIECSSIFRELLMSKVGADPSIAAVIEQLDPLFDEIESGRIVPPVENRCGRIFHSEDPQYGQGTDVYNAFAHFLSALEDWPSKPWYPIT